MAMRDVGKLWREERHARMRELAAVLWRWDIDTPGVRAALGAVNREVCEPPLREGELAAIADSAFRYLPAGGIVPPGVADALARRDAAGDAAE